MRAIHMQQTIYKLLYTILALLILLWAPVCIGQTGYTDMAGDEEIDGYQRVVIRYPSDKSFMGFEIGHKLIYDADENSLTVRRYHWRALAGEFNRIGPTPDNKAAIMSIGKHTAYVIKTQEADELTAILFLPDAIINDVSGPFTFTLSGNFNQFRSLTQQMTTITGSFSGSYRHEWESGNAFEGTGQIGYTYIQEKEREDADIRWRDISGDDIQDSRQAALDLAYYYNLARETALGRIDAGLSIGGSYEKDELNLLDMRRMPYAGGNLRFSSETYDDLSCQFSLRAMDVYEKWVGDDEEQHMPSWQFIVSGEAPLYRLNHMTMILFEGNVGVLQSFDNRSDNGELNRHERIINLETGLSFQTPMGFALGLNSKLEWLHIPGSAGARIEEFNESYTWEIAATIEYTFSL